MRKFTATALVIALSFPPSFAFADANAAADLYREASEAYQQGNFKAAATLLEKAYLEDANLIYKYNQILAYMGSKQHKEALRVLKDHSEAMKADGRFDDIEEIQLQLETAIAEQEKAEQDKAATASASPTDYGNTDASVTPPPSTTESSGSPNYLAWTLVGVGAVTLASSALFFSHALIPEESDRLTKFHQRKAEIGNNRAFIEVYGGETDAHQKIAELDAKAETKQNNIGAITLGTGIALIGTGLALWYFDVPGGSSDESLVSKMSDDSNTLRVRFEPYFSTESAGASMHLKF